MYELHLQSLFHAVCTLGKTLLTILVTFGLHMVRKLAVRHLYLPTKKFACIRGAGDPLRGVHAAVRQTLGIRPGCRCNDSEGGEMGQRGKMFSDA